MIPLNEDLWSAHDLLLTYDGRASDGSEALNPQVRQAVMPNVPSLDAWLKYLKRSKGKL